jgi:CRISPR/Cas system endoribonuclease Cas6 (RAMP superfamily)
MCHQAEEKEPLYYLCFLKYSTLLTKAMFQEDRGIMLFSTCGHLIHESCLNESLQQNKKYNASYSCFLCSKISNFRIPFKFKDPT